MSSSIQIPFLEIVVAVAAILLDALTGMSIGVAAIFVLTGAVYFAFLQSGSREGDGASSLS